MELQMLSNKERSRLYLPLWSETEIMEAAEFLDLRLEYDFHQNLFSRLGGSVRYIVTENEKFRKKGLQNQEKAFNSIEIFMELKKGMTKISFIHKVFYFVPNMNCPDEYEMHLGSIYIAFCRRNQLKRG